ADPGSAAGSDGGSKGTGIAASPEHLSSPPVPPPAPAPPAIVTEPPLLAPPEEGITVTGGGTDLPHWTDPPTGEVPRILADDQRDSEPGEDDLAAWNALGSRGMRWRDESEDWADVDEIGELGTDVPRVGALDTTRSEHSDLYSFDE